MADQEMSTNLSEARWSQLSEFVAEQMGLHFPRERWRDLERGITAAVRALKYADLESYIDRLLSSPPTKKEIEILASHLTVTETYFFRDKETFQVLQKHVLPDLIRAREGNDRQLRIWSAGCATGEEPYSVGISLSRVLPDRKDWSITILGTDINPGSLKKASEGFYGEWSFRAVPAEVKEQYFQRREGGQWKLSPRIKEMVAFSYLNLAEDLYPSLLNGTNAMDVILCRNVLMYFEPERAKKVVQALQRCLVEGGWLIVSPTEASHVLFSEFTPVNFPGVIFYRKQRQREHRATIPPLFKERKTEELFPLSLDQVVPPQPPTPVSTEVQESPGWRAGHQESSLPSPISYAEALRLYEQGRYEETAKTLTTFLSKNHLHAAAVALLARTYANLGQLDEALTWCERAIVADKLNPSWHYLRATILQERGGAEEARLSLHRALYLDSRFVLGHFALAHLLLREGKLNQARKHFQNALTFLNFYPRDHILPESDGISAGRLVEIIHTLKP